MNARLLAGWARFTMLSSALWGGLVAVALAQPAAPAPAPAAAAQDPSPAERNLFPVAPYRQLVPGVERTFNAERDFKELTSRHDMVELLKVDANYNWAKDITFRHDIWALELSVKPIRFIYADLPGAEGKLRRKMIWYMVYRVNNPGVVYHAEPTVYAPAEEDEKLSKLVGDRDVDPAKRELKAGEIQQVRVGEPIKFVPSFLLYSRDNGKAYLDRVLPTVQKLIQEREDIRRPLKNSVEIAGEIPASTPEQDNSVWGVAMWEDVDPQTDFFSLYIQGLTNAYKWVDLPDDKRWYSYKTLRMDFWRPGDDIDESEDEIRFLRSRWLYMDKDWATAPDKAGIPVQ